MRFGIIAVAFLAMVTTSAALAASEDEIMISRYGNTLVIKDTFGTSRVYYNKDHTFKAASWLGDVTGHWKLENGKMCLYAEQYPALYRLKYSIPECDPITVRKVGEKWDENGRHYELVQGILS
jgi:hypothetical protein